MLNKLRITQKYYLLLGFSVLVLNACSSSGWLDSYARNTKNVGHLSGSSKEYHVGKPYKIAGKWYKPQKVNRYEKIGLASWYGDAFHGRKTANGEIFNMNALTAAHPTLPLPSYVRITNLENNRSVVVRVNDRGPFSGNRIIDVSKRAANVLGFRQKGIAKVRVNYLRKASIR